MNRVLQISFTAYGPNGYDHLLEVKHAFLDGSDYGGKVVICKNHIGNVFGDVGSGNTHSDTYIS